MNDEDMPSDAAWRKRIEDLLELILAEIRQRPPGARIGVVSGDGENVPFTVDDAPVRG